MGRSDNSRDLVRGLGKNRWTSGRSQLTWPLHDRLLVRVLLQRHLVLEHAVHAGAAHDVLGGRAVRPGARLGRVGEGQPGGVDDAVAADERNGDLGGLSNPLPPASEEGDVRHDADHALLAAEHRLGLDVTEPDAEVGTEVLSGQLQHRSLTASVQLEDKQFMVSGRRVAGSNLGTGKVLLEKK